MTTHKPAFSISFTIIALLTAIILLGIYVSWLNVNYSYDSIGYAIYVTKALHFGEFQLWHKYHLLYMWLGYLVSSLIQAFSQEMIDVLLVMQMVNSFTTCLYVFLFARLVYALTRNAVVSLVFTLLLAFSHGVWYYSTDAEVYPPAILFSILALWAFHKECEQHRWTAIIATGIFAGFATGFHVASGLLFPILLTAMFGHNLTKQNVWRNLRRCAVFSVVFFLMAFLPYMYFYHAVKGTNLIAGLFNSLDEARTFNVDGHTWWLKEGIQAGRQMHGVLRGFAALPHKSSSIATISAYALHTFLIITLVTIPIYIKSLWKKFGWMVVVLGGSSLLFFLFFSTYNVGSLKFVTFIHLPFLLLAALTASEIRWPRPLAILLSGVVLLLFFHNLYSQVLPNSRIENNIQYAKSLFIKEWTKPNDLIIHRGTGENIFQKVYLPYFGMREELILDFLLKDLNFSQETIIRSLNWKLSETWKSGGHTFIVSDALEDTPSMRQFLANRQLPADFFLTYFKNFSVKFVAAFDENFTLYEIVPLR